MKRIIIADDESSVREGVSMLLAALYDDTEIFSVASVEELKAQLSQGEYRTVVLTDLMTDDPGSIAELVMIDPNASLYIMSGYNVRSPHIQALRQYGVRGFLQKPFEIEELTDIIDREF